MLVSEAEVKAARQLRNIDESRIVRYVCAPIRKIGASIGGMVGWRCSQRSFCLQSWLQRAGELRSRQPRRGSHARLGVMIVRRLAQES